MVGAWSIIAALSFGCRPAQDAGEGRDAGRLVITGSSTVAPLVAEIVKRFEATHPGARIDVQTGGTARGLADLARGLAGCAMVSRALRPEETEQGLVAHPVALDGIVLILHRDNPVRALTRAQVVAIYEGRVRRWREVGGADSPITVVHKAAGRSTLELFLEHYGLRAEVVRADVVIGDNPQGIRTVALDARAIGYVSVGAAAFEVTRGTAIRLLPVDDVEPTAAAVRSGAYPLTRPLNLVTRGAPTGLERTFIDYATSNAVQDLVDAQHLASVGE